MGETVCTSGGSHENHDSTCELLSAFVLRKLQPLLLPVGEKTMAMLYRMVSVIGTLRCKPLMQCRDKCRVRCAKLNQFHRGGVGLSMCWAPVSRRPALAYALREFSLDREITPVKLLSLEVCLIRAISVAGGSLTVTVQTTMPRGWKWCMVWQIERYLGFRRRPPDGLARRGRCSQSSMAMTARTIVAMMGVLLLSYAKTLIPRHPYAPSRTYPHLDRSPAREPRGQRSYSFGW
jgi:hypothetical protein